MQKWNSTENFMRMTLYDCLFFFDTEKECYDFYRIFEQELTDSSAIYACTFGPDGQCETENT